MSGDKNGEDADIFFAQSHKDAKLIGITGTSRLNIHPNNDQID